MSTATTTRRVCVRCGREQHVSMFYACWSERKLPPGPRTICYRCRHPPLRACTQACSARTRGKYRVMLADLSQPFDRLAEYAPTLEQARARAAQLNAESVRKYGHARGPLYYAARPENSKQRRSEE
jgi:hypothetical protein